MSDTGPGRVDRPGRGDVDLEALQDAFLRSAEAPSAKVTRSKAPTVRSASGVSKKSGLASVPEVASESEKTLPLRQRVRSERDDDTRDQRTQPTDENGNGQERKNDADDPAPLREPAGRMLLTSPGVMSSVKERPVNGPTPMRVSVGGGFDRESRPPQGREFQRSRLRTKIATSGGFPAVRHRSEMGHVNLARGEDRNSQEAASSRSVSDAGALDVPAPNPRRTSQAAAFRSPLEEIDQENASRVLTMSSEEIDEAQREIRASLSSDTIEMLMRRGRAKTATRGVVDHSAPSAGFLDGDSAMPRSASGPSQAGRTSHPSDARAVAEVGGVSSIGDGDGDAADAMRRQPDKGGGGNPGTGRVRSGEEDAFPGAPTRAQQRATAVGGIDSEEGLAKAIASLPQDERAKSLWASSTGDAPVGDGIQSTDESGPLYGASVGVVRVDLDGNPVESAASGEGLHHHGDDPDKAGYTPPELLRLARSTVSSQRQLGLRSLTGVLRGRAACIARGETPPHPRLPEMVPVAIRLGLDDGNSSVAFTALSALEAFLAPLAQEEEDEESMLLGLSWLDNRAFEVEVRPLCSPIEESLLPSPGSDHPSDDGTRPGTKGDAGGFEGWGVEESACGQEAKSMSELARLCYEDPTRGMLEMSLLPRLRDLIRLYGSLSSPSGENPPHSIRVGDANAPTPTASMTLGASDSSSGVSHSSCAPGKPPGDHASGLHDGSRRRYGEGGGEGTWQLRPCAALSCLRVLCAIARRGPWTSARVAKEPGLLDAIREAFLEPLSDGSLPVELERQYNASRWGFNGGSVLRGGTGTAEGTQGWGSSREGTPVKGQLALVAVRLVRVLAQSSREVALLLARGPLLGSAKGLLALGKGSASPCPALQTTQREVLELWCVCLSYGVDVTSTDTVVLVSREQGWWPSTYRQSREAALSSISKLSLDHRPLAGSGSVGGTGSGRCGDNGVVGSGGASTREAIRLEVSFYRALHQLLCACVVPPSASDGDGAVRSKDGVERSADPGVSIAGVKVLPDTWAAVGDTVDAAVEATVGWLLERYRPRDARWGSCTNEALSDRAVEPCEASGMSSVPFPEFRLLPRLVHDLLCVLIAVHGSPAHYPVTGAQCAALHLVACWMERHRAMSRSSGRRGRSHLASIAEDTSILFSSLIASEVLLPAKVAEVTSSLALQPPAPVGNTDQVLENFSVAGDGAPCVSDIEIVIVGLDWLSAVFRLGMACEKLEPGEVSATVATAPETSVAAFANFLSNLCGYDCGDEVFEHKRGQHRTRRLARRASACARWLGCRLAGKLAREVEGAGDVQAKGYPWANLSRDCALQALHLCDPGDEALAVGLVAEALPDPMESDGVENNGARSLLSKMFRNAISDPVALAQSSSHLDGRWESLRSLRFGPPPGATSLLPLPRHWLLLPLASQGGERTAAALVSACLSVLVRLEREGSAYVSNPSAEGSGINGNTTAARAGLPFLSPEVKLYHLANACLYGAAVLSDEATGKHFDWLLNRYLEQCEDGFEGRLTSVVERLAASSPPDPSKVIEDAVAISSSASGAIKSSGNARRRGGESRSEEARGRMRAMRARQGGAERALSEFVRDLVSSFLADSFGLINFASVLRLFLRTGFSPTARCIIWKEIGDLGLLSLLDPQTNSSGVGHGSVGASGGSTGGDCRGAAPGRRVIAEQNSSGARFVESPDPYLYPPDMDISMIDAYLSALEHPRFGPGGRTGMRDGCSKDSVEVTSSRGKERVAGVVSNEAAEAVQIESGRLMRLVAIHHVACYLFPPIVRSGGDNIPIESEGVGDVQMSSVWRPDYGRRMRFERLLRMNADRGVESASAAVIGYGCGETERSANGFGRGRGGARDGVKVDSGSTAPAASVWKPCSSTQGLARDRRRLLQSYCDAVGCEMSSEIGKLAVGDIIGKLRSHISR